MITKTLLLDSRTGDPRAAIRRALYLVNASRGLTLADDGCETLDEVTYTVWTDDVDGVTETSWVRLVDDAPARARYLELHAVDDGTLAGLRDAIAAELPVLSHAEIDAAVRDDPSLVSWLGHGCTDRPFDANVVPLIETALASSDPDVVAQAQVAVFLLRWRSLLPLVERALALTTSPTRRAALQAIVTASAEWS